MAERRSRPAAGRQPANATAAGGELTLEQLKQRAAISGIEVPDDHWELMAQSVNLALRSLRLFRASENRGREPAVRFEP